MQVWSRPSLGGLRRLNKLETNALALMVATAMTALLGLGFWAVAAHLYSPAVVGSSSAMLSASSLLSALALMNLPTVFQRYLPVAGVHTRRIVLGCYALVAVTGTVVSAAFVLSPFGSTILVKAGHAGMVLVILVAFSTVFTLQDSVLVGLRNAKWVPLENSLFAAAKVGLLPVLAAGTLGIVYAWGIPLVLAIAAITTLLLTRVIPRHMQQAQGQHGLPPVGDVVAHAGGEYLVGIATYIMPLALPLLVVYHLGPEANAYFYVAWIINSTLNLLIVNITSSLLVEASHRPSAAPALVRRAAVMAWGVAIAGSLVIIVFAPFMLSLMGPGYATTGTAVSRILAVAVPFNVINLLLAAICRIERRVRWLVLMQVSTATLIIAGSAYILPRHGVVGLAYVYATVIIVTSLIVVTPLRRALRRLQHVEEPTPTTVAVA